MRGGAFLNGKEGRVGFRRTLKVQGRTGGSSKQAASKQPTSKTRTHIPSLTPNTKKSVASLPRIFYPFPSSASSILPFLSAAIPTDCYSLAFFLLASSISLVSSLASVTAILMTIPIKPITIIPTIAKIIFNHIVFCFLKVYNFVIKFFNSIYHYSRLSLKQSSDKLWNFPHHLLDLRGCRTDTRRLIHSDILLPHLLSSVRVSTQTTHAHSHNILFQIRYTQLTTKTLAEKEV